MTGKSVIWVEYKSAINGRVARFLCKVPYGQAPDLMLRLNRAFQVGQIARFTISDLLTGEMDETTRDGLLRWNVALDVSANRTKVDWLA